MIIGITGKIGSGKDTVANIINYHIAKKYWKAIDWSFYRYKTDPERVEELLLRGLPVKFRYDVGLFAIKKWADDLKDIMCIILGCTREQIEDREWKEAPLGEEWALLRETSSYGAPDVIYPVDYKGLTHIAHTHKEVLTPRKMLQLLGTEGGRKIIHPNIWVNALMSRYKPVLHTEGEENNDGFTMTCKEFPNWIITDTRFPNEVEAIKDKGGIIINIQRPETDHLAGTHESETALDNYDYNPYVIVNDGDMFHLVIKIEKLLKQLNLVTL